MTRERQQKPDLNLQRHPDPTRTPSQRANNAPNQTPRLPPLRAPTPAQFEASQQRREAELQNLARLEAKRQLEVTQRERVVRIQGKLETRRVDRTQPTQVINERLQMRVERKAIALNGEAQPDELNSEMTAQVQTQERQARLEAQQAAFAVWQQLEAQQDVQRHANDEREQRVSQANQQAVAFGTGQTASANGLGGVISTLATDERLEVFQSIRDQHPTTWAKLETLPLVRWDEEWQARVAEQRVQVGGSSDTALLSEAKLEQRPDTEQNTALSATELRSRAAKLGNVESNGFEDSSAQTVETEQRPTAETLKYAEMLRRAFNIYVRSPVPPVQMSAASKEEFQQLVNAVLDADAFRTALYALEPTYPELKRAEVLRVLLSLTTQRTRMTIQALGGIEQITFDGFVEQLSGFMAYSNTLDFSDLNNPKDAKSGASKILQSFGYKATPAIHGAWGLQMMIFTPIPSLAKYAHTILAFRGTEAVKSGGAAANAATSRRDPNAFRRDNESELDTATDFNESDIAYTQFDTNRALIADAVKNATRGGSAVVSGHSLGGGLAQVTAARFPVFEQLLTFQAPHVKAEDIERLEAQKKLRSMNYRMNMDVVPRGGPQNKMAGEIAVFEDQNTSANKPFNSHHTPMLAELLEQTKAEGGRLTPQQAALVDNGKQPPNELNDPGQDANTVRLQQLVPGKDDATVAIKGSAGYFYGLNQNVVTNNLLVNVMRELLLPDLEKLTSANIRRNGGTKTLLERLNRQRDRIGQQEFFNEARAQSFSSASQTILEAYGDADKIFTFDVTRLRDELKMTAVSRGSDHPKHKLLEIALWWKTGEQSDAVNDIIETTRFMARQDLGRWWYSLNLDGEDLYRQLKNSDADPRYL